MCVFEVLEWQNLGAASSQTDIGYVQRYSQRLCPQVPQTAGTEGLVTSVLWVIRCLSVSCREKSILQLQSPLPVLLRSQQSLRPLKKKRRLKLEETFSTCILVFFFFSPLITLLHNSPSFSSSSESYGWLSLEAKPLKKKDKNDF